MTNDIAQPLAVPDDAQISISQDATIAEVDDVPVLSKSASKRLRKQAAYDAARPQRIAKRKMMKQKTKASKNSEQTHEVKKRTTVHDQVPSSLRLLVDCSFDDKMTDRVRILGFLIKNRSTKHPVEYIISPFTDRVALRFSNVFANQHKSWRGVTVLERDCLINPETSDGFDKDDMIYLSADSDTALRSIDESKLYIIGGIVDKNRHKNICKEKAELQGIKTARLPIGDYLKMASRQVLTVNHVFEIILRWLE